MRLSPHRPAATRLATAALLLSGGALARAQSLPPQSGSVCTHPANEPALVRFPRSLGFGTTPQLSDWLLANGSAPWILQQLDPGSIDESGNQALQDVLAGLHEPASQGDPQATIELLADRVLARALFSEKQLETRLTVFWRNHFTTSYADVASKVKDKGTSVWFQATELEAFRQLALGRFGDLLRTSATSPAMLFYLDSYLSSIPEPNENYGRELLELHTLGENNGYTSTDVATVAAVFSGWSAEKVLPADAGNPQASPISCAYERQSFFAGDVDHDGRVDTQDLELLQEHSQQLGGQYQARLDIYPPPATFCPDGPYGDGVIDGLDFNVVTSNDGQEWWVYSFVFVPARHDYAAKTVFGSAPGTIAQVALPTFAPGDPSAYLEGFALLDHLAASSGCADFIVRKLFQYFVNDEDLGTFDPGLLAALKARWASNGGRIEGVLRDLVAATLSDPSYDMDYDKVRDLLERAVAFVRALDGRPPAGPTAWESVDALRVWIDFVYPLFRYPAPDGFSEVGDEVNDTQLVLEGCRLFQMVWDTSGSYDPPLPAFAFDLYGQMTQAGVDLSDATEIVCYLLRRLLPGNFAPADRALAEDFLTTTPAGAPFVLDPVNNLSALLRQTAKTAGFLACLPQFLEQ